MLKFFKEYFNLSNNEQRGIIGLLLIILFVFVGTRIFLMFKPAAEIPQDNTSLLAEFYEDSVSYNTKEPKFENDKKDLKAEIKITYFKFNPNLASKNELMQLGFSEKAANVLINYRNKGGQFYKKEDLKKVYGVSNQLYANLESYIDIPKKEYTNNKYQNNYKKEESKTNTYNNEEKIDYTPIIVNINTADSIQLIQIKGIGKIYAARIIKYRNLLGGFKEPQQIKEVYGINEEVYEALKNQIEVGGTVQKINVNTATWAELKNHPYINSNMAGIITKYIKANGKVTDLDKILNPNIFDEQTINKVKPYLSTE